MSAGGQERPGRKPSRSRDPEAASPALEQPKRNGPDDAPVSIGTVLAEMFGRMVLEEAARRRGGMG